MGEGGGVAAAPDLRRGDSAAQVRRAAGTHVCGYVQASTPEVSMYDFSCKIYVVNVEILLGIVNVDFVFPLNKI
jgi:hypothetical protein